MEEIGVAVQSVEVGIKGIETAVRLTGNLAGWTVEKISQLVKFIIARVEKQKNAPETLAKGEMELDKLLKYNAEYGEQTMILQIDDDIKDIFVQYCNDNKLAYSFLVDLNKRDGKTEVAYNESQSEVFGVFLRNYPEKARPYSFNEYIDNATAEDINNVNNELSAEVQEDYGVIDIGNLSEKYKYLAVITMKKEQYDAFMEKVPDVSHAVVFDNNEQISIAIGEADYDKTVSFFRENGLEKVSLAEYLTENWQMLPDKTLSEAAKNGKHANISENGDMVQISERQITEVNDFSAKVRLLSGENAAYINVPINNIYNSDTAGKFDVFIEKNDAYRIYQESHFTELNKEGKVEVLKQTPTERLTGDKISEMLTDMDTIYTNRQTEIKDIKLSDKFVNTPVEKEPEQTVKEAVKQTSGQEKEEALKKQEKQPAEREEKAVYQDITIDMSMLAPGTKLSDSKIDTIIPYTGRNLVLTLERKDIEIINEDKTMLTKLDMNKEYELTTLDFGEIVKMKGKELYDKHYDPVNREVRQRANGRYTNKNKVQNRNAKMSKTQVRNEPRKPRTPARGR